MPKRPPDEYPRGRPADIQPVLWRALDHLLISRFSWLDLIWISIVTQIEVDYGWWWIWLCVPCAICSKAVETRWLG